MQEAVTATARALRSAGVGPDSTVGIRMRRRPETVVLLWALWRTGAVAAPLSTRLPAEGLRETVQRMSIRPVVTDDPTILDALPQEIVRAAGDLVRWNAAGSAPSADAAEYPLDREATLVFTSGSTGTPKAALHTLRNHVASAAGSNANISVNPGDRWLLSLPLYHVGGLAILFRCALGGAGVALPDPEAALAESIEACRATHLSLVATQARRLLDRGTTGRGGGESGEEGGGLPERVRAVLVGGGPVPAALLDRAGNAGWPVHTTYGCTEMASQVTTTSADASRADLATAGRLLPHRALRIDADAETSEGSETGPGEILLGGAVLFRGYVEPDGAGGLRLDPARDEDGWYSSGDRGRIDAEGRLRVIGRIDRLFISGGENIQPEEIEAALEQIEGIDRAVVVPVSHAEYGQRPVAFVRAADWSPTEWRRHLAERLPGFKIPDAFEPLPAQAVEGRMKVDRHALRAQAEADDDTESSLASSSDGPPPEA
jgi:O-succinylbenzoic acid--CoA ligase